MKRNYLCVYLCQSVVSKRAVSGKKFAVMFGGLAEKAYFCSQKILYMRRLLMIAVAIAAVAAKAVALPMDSIRARLERGPVQEKVYLHLDNQCYFLGDTIWYKAYVVEAEGLRESQMSRVCYVELVTPDGLVVERQQLIVTPEGYCCGDFTLPDSLYSGYYELRAYTRWMLNFNVEHRPYRLKDRRMFYSAQMASDFFRDYGNICSRVVPVYQRPDEEGDWASKAIYQRAKQRKDKQLKPALQVSFFPEGGALVAGHRQRVAFEATDEQGRAVSVSGTIDGQPAATEHQGRGACLIDVKSQAPKASFAYNGQTYDFELPTPQTGGAVVSLADGVARIEGSGEMAVAILCRGRLRHFDTFTDNCQLTLGGLGLPTGVNDLLVISGEGTILADRLFFIDNHDMGATIGVSGLKDEYQPYEQIALTFSCPDTKHLSIAVRDGATDELSYDDGNLLTDLLLSSELKGFVANPSFYFEPGHESQLDLLMLVQGWRRYDARPILSQQPLRYRPEGVMTVEGGVYEIDDIHELVAEDFQSGMLVYQQMAFGSPQRGKASSSFLDSNAEVEGLSGLSETADDATDDTTDDATDAAQDDTTDGQLQTGRRAKRAVNVHGELIVGNDVATVDVPTDSRSQFAFDLPPFYGNAVLKLSAARQDQSEKRQKKMQTKGVTDETAVPDYYVKRNLFYPVFAKKYSWYQCHQPEATDGATTADDGALDIEQVSTMDDELDEITVKGKKRRGRRKIDFSRPAMVYDAYTLYNLVADYGLSCAYFDIRTFPYDLAYLLLGNYDGHEQMSLEARLGLRPFYRVIPSPTEGSLSEPMDNRSPQTLVDNLRLKRLDQVRLYTDFELRNPEKPLERTSSWADVTLDFTNYENDAETITFRDRHIVIEGFTAPRDFYHPDYSARPLPDAKDYRRTLYWEPNARPDADGRFTATFYNNGKPTRPRVDACAVTTAGRLGISK